MFTVDRRRCGSLIVVAGVFTSAAGVQAQDAAPQPTEAAAGDSATVATPTEAPASPYAGDLWSRAALTGNWGGVRDELAAKGITFQSSLTQVWQGVVDGGRRREWEYGGRGELTMNLDLGKAELMPGASLLLRAEGKYGDTVNPHTGALMPANAGGLFPEPVDDSFVLPAVVFTQFFSPKFGVFAGKLDTSGGDMNDFAHSKGDKQFLNLGFGFNPVAAATTPYSTLGAGFFVVPHEQVMLTATVYDTEGRPDTSGFDTVFNGGTSFAAEARITTNFFGLLGHQTFGGAYSTKDYGSLNQPLSAILPDVPFGRETGSWCVYYNFDQYFFHDKARGRGFGIFARFGAADGDTNPIEFFASVGFGGTGVIPSRPLDRCGIGYYYMWASDGNVPEFIGLDDEQGFEAFYEIAITPAVRLTPDVQVINPSRERVDTAVVLGVRLRLEF